MGGAGVFKSHHEAVSECVRITYVTEPDLGNHREYNRLFGIHAKLHSLLEGLEGTR